MHIMHNVIEVCSVNQRHCKTTNAFTNNDCDCIVTETFMTNEMNAIDPV